MLNDTTGIRAVNPGMGNFHRINDPCDRKMQGNNLEKHNN